MMFSGDDFKVESWCDFFEFLLIAPFVGLVLPFIGAAYALGFMMDVTGWLDT